MENLYLRFAPALIAIIELILMGAAALLILRSQRRGRISSYQSFSFQSLERAFDRLARRRWLAVFVVGAGVIVMRTALIPVLGIPQPRFHDEFSYLLAADTFAHGRVTNPTHPMWIHFETFHIIQHPTYMSLFPPAQGLVLAAGQLLGHVWIGQLLITGAMCSALCWMLQAWVPPRWALLGGVLAALRLGILSYWMNGYWSASIVALGGVLVLGAWPRVRNRVSGAQSAILSLGLVILANSRPYEGLIFAVPVALSMSIWLFGLRHPRLWLTFPRVVLPVILVLLVGGLATGCYYYRVTGSAFRMTYQVSSAQYGTAPYFLWQTPRPLPVYHHAVIRDYYRSLLAKFNRDRTLEGYLLDAGQKFESWWQFYLGPLLTLPLLAIPSIVHERKFALPILICGAMVAGFAVETWTLPHYFSPATGALYILLVQGLRHLRLWRHHRGDLGRTVVRAVFLVASAMIVLRVTAAATGTHIEPDWPRGNLDRASMLHQLRQFPGDQLVFVRYGNHHNVDYEWVWNEASIDTAKVVWARDMGESQNQELLNYFPNRRAWMIEGDDLHPKLNPYVVSGKAARPLR